MNKFLVNFFIVWVLVAAFVFSFQEDPPQNLNARQGILLQGGGTGHETVAPRGHFEPASDKPFTVSKRLILFSVVYWMGVIAVFAARLMMKNKRLYSE